MYSTRSMTQITYVHSTHTLTSYKHCRYIRERRGTEVVHLDTDATLTSHNAGRTQKLSIVRTYVHVA
uniref:Uncharacterized protein n=1 Tax=Oryza brachyantha TaxID=4533 RepID=J3LD92_ORYBR